MSKDKQHAENLEPGHTLWVGRHREACEFWESKADEWLRQQAAR